MSKFLHHEGCPDCLSNGKDRDQNNLGVWDDGHKWCFSCGYHSIPKKDNNYVRQKLTTDAKEISGISVNLPSDAGRDLALEAVIWIRKYDLTIEDVRLHNFLWSQSRRILVMPVYEKHTRKPLYWQGKHFNEEIAAKMKYQTFGAPGDHIEEVGNREGETIVLVEDKLSAIKVARVNTAMPLYGSNLNLKQAIMLAARYQQCVIWLDRDKLSASIEMKDWLSVYFEHVKIVSTERDPKEYDEQNIQNAILPESERDWKDAIKILNRGANEELIQDEEVVDRYRKWDGGS